MKKTFEAVVRAAFWAGWNARGKAEHTANSEYWNAYDSFRARLATRNWNV